MINVEDARSIAYNVRAKVSQNPCFICGRELNPFDKIRSVHVIGDSIVTKAEADEIYRSHADPGHDVVLVRGSDVDDRGFYPIGPECARRLKEYVS